MKNRIWILAAMVCLAGSALAVQHGPEELNSVGLDRSASHPRSFPFDRPTADRGADGDKQLADPVNTSWIGAWAAGPSLAVGSRGDLTCFGNGGYLEVLDTTIPGHPVRLGRVVLPGPPLGLAIAGDHAYAACAEAGLVIVDISDPSQPFTAGSIFTGYLADEVAVSGGMAYVAAGWDGLFIIDVSDPTAPVEVGFLPPGEFSYFSGVAVEGDHAFITDRFSGFLSVDVTDPTNPVIQSEVSSTGAIPESVAVMGGLALVAGLNRFQVFDVSHPATVQLLGELEVDGARGVAADGGYAYLGDEDGLRIIGIGDPQVPVEVGLQALPSAAFGVALVGGRAYVSDVNNGLRVVDVTDPVSPVEEDILATGSITVKARVAGSYAYVCQWEEFIGGFGGLKIIDLHDPAAPQEVGSFTPAAPPDLFQGFTGLAVQGGYVFAIDDYNGMWIIDVSDPSAPFQETYLGLDSYPVDIAVREGYAYVTIKGTEDNLLIFDVSNPAAPVRVGSFASSGMIAAADGYLYLATWYTLLVVDVSDPATPTEVAAAPLFTYMAYAIALEGDRIHIATFDGLRIFDVSDPVTPVETSSTTIGFGAMDVAVHHGFVYLSDPFFYVPEAMDDGLLVVDATDPYNPVEAGSFDTAGLARGVTAKRNLVYVSDDLDGLQIIRNDLDHSDLLVTLTPQNAPLTIPETGGGFFYDAAVENVSATDIVADVVLEAVFPGGRSYRITTISDVVFPAGSTTVRHGLSQIVPAAAPAGAYAYRLSLSGGDGTLIDADEFTFGKLGALAAAKSADAEAGWILEGWDDAAVAGTAPVRPALVGAYPNPCNPMTTIRYALPAPAVVSLGIFDLRGREVRTLVSGQSREAGIHAETWRGDDDDGRPVAGGVYLYRLDAGDVTVAKRVTLVR